MAQISIQIRVVGLML
ncbi:hypothetical protein A2U01_0088592, partial [Trifolium medium]|nr:hypothetical protein [Trifolium medium]